MGGFDKISKTNIMTPEEVARYLQLSLSWIYKHWRDLGGVKLGGSIRFPSKEELHERLFGKGPGEKNRLHLQGSALHGNLVQNQNRGQASRIQNKGGAEKPAAGSVFTDRHGLLGAG